MSDKRKRAARAIMAETGWNYTRALREADRRHAEAQAASTETDLRITRTLDGDPAALGITRVPFPGAVFLAPEG